MPIIKNIKVGILIKLINIAIIFSFKFSFAQSNENLVGSKTNIKILDKISSKNELVNLINGEELIYNDIAIKIMKCANSEFDDNPETNCLYSGKRP